MFNVGERVDTIYGCGIITKIESVFDYVRYIVKLDNFDNMPETYRDGLSELHETQNGLVFFEKEIRACLADVVIAAV